MTLTPAPSAWWDRSRHQDRRGFLLARGALKRAMRSWFEARGFTEVEAGQLQASPGNETHLHAFATERVSLDGMRSPLYLHTSPEFACKKLLAAGETAIFDFARVFRNRESGPLHANEFTMLEWYRAGEGWDTVIADTLALVRLAARSAGSAAFQWRGRTVAADAEPERLTVHDAFVRHAGIDLLACLEPDGTGNRTRLADAAQASGVTVSADDSWSDIFSKVLVARVEPQLGLNRPCVLCEYPAEEAALARRTPHDPRVAERFELYVCGVELANGFGELTDPEEQRDRFEAAMALKQTLYGERYPIDGDLLAALAVMPPASGVALGFDRLVMLVTGARTIADVQWTA